MAPLTIKRIAPNPAYPSQLKTSFHVPWCVVRCHRAISPVRIRVGDVDRESWSWSLMPRHWPVLRHQCLCLRAVHLRSIGVVHRWMRGVGPVSRFQCCSDLRLRAEPVQAIFHRLQDVYHRLIDLRLREQAFGVFGILACPVRMVAHVCVGNEQ
jgi:hypothetical protein